MLYRSRHRTIFACCAEGWQAVTEAALAAKRCGSCGGVEALRATTGALAALATQCRAAHTRLSPGAGAGAGAGGAGAGARAARWLADDDIVRFLQSLPNWRAALSTAPTSAQELKQAYEREAEILGSSLGDGAVTKREIVSDINVLTDLALLCESMKGIPNSHTGSAYIMRSISTIGVSRILLRETDSELPGGSPEAYPPKPVLYTFSWEMKTGKLWPSHQDTQVLDYWSPCRWKIGETRVNRVPLPDRRNRAMRERLPITSAGPDDDDWLSTNIKTIPSIVSGSSSTGGGIKLTDKFVSDINSAAMIFEEISHKCLLFLHLELRIECFYYLGQEERAEGAAEEGGGAEAGGAARLAHALLAFHEHAAAILAPQALAYVFGGLGEMMSAGVVWRWQGAGGCGGAVGGGGGGGAEARLATLRHALAALQLPHHGLHRAHDYLHLLAATPEVCTPPCAARPGPDKWVLDSGVTTGGKWAKCYGPPAGRGDNIISPREGSPVLGTRVLECVQSDRRSSWTLTGRYADAAQTIVRRARTRRRYCIV
ncbi:unnamed protein product [Diatraea saccharalis]|uniref:Exocyst complex component Sec8 n=1 Tax=Diatraea saccharalis TaxID=40085 RepID=A0A9N9QXI1_9NEOP|nr:unnamed protein product [Diatraea saccharalis]